MKSATVIAAERAAEAAELNANAEEELAQMEAADAAERGPYAAGTSENTGGGATDASGSAGMGMSPEAHAAMGKGAESAADTAATTEAEGMGVVKAIDAAGGKVTIAHEPIAALNWPAMTMGFNASRELLASVKEGDSVHFELKQAGSVSALSVLQARK